MSNQLFIEWVNYLEGGSQKEFCLRTHISEATVSRIRNQTSSPGKSTIKRLREVYGLSPQEYELGPEIYEKLRQEKVTSSFKSQVEMLNPDKASNIYPLSRIQKTLERSFCLGVCWYRQFDNNPKDYIYVYVDRDKQAIEFGEMVCVKLNEAPEKEDTVLVFDGKSAGILKLKNKSDKKNFEKVFGVVVERIRG